MKSKIVLLLILWMMQTCAAYAYEPLPLPPSKGGSGNPSIGVSATAVVTGDGSKLLQTANGSALQQIRVNAAGTALEWFTPPTLTVPGGGTGATTLTNHGVLLGQGTSAVAATSAGTSGQLLTSNGASSDPTFTTYAGTSSISTVGTITTGTWNGTDVAVPDGGTGVSTLTNHGVVIGQGTSAVAVTSAGTAGQVLKSNGASSDPTFQDAGSSGGFAGNGADGSITISGSTTYSGALQKNTTSFTVDSSKTLTCNTASPVIINSTGTIDVNGTITCTAGSGNGKGGAGANLTSGTGSSNFLGSPGSGPGGGRCNYQATTTGLSNIAPGGGGGGSGGDGGDAGVATTPSDFSPGIKGTAYYSWIGGGSGGSGGGVAISSGNNVGGNGGNGGMCLILCSVGALTVASTGVITANGANGSAGTTSVGGAAAGGGGGGGGHVWLISQTSVTTTASGTITCNGGNGGNGSAGNKIGAGGGGGGKLFLWSPSNSNSSTNTFNGGSGGSGSTSNGNSGSAGSATTITGTPNHPLLVWMGIMRPTDVAEARTWGDGIKFIQKHSSFTSRDLARAYSKGDLNLYAKALTPGFDSQEPTCLDADQKEVFENVA